MSGLTTSITNTGASTIDVDANVVAEPSVKVGRYITIDDGVNTSAVTQISDITGQVITVVDLIDQTFASGSNVNVIGHWAYLWQEDSTLLTTCPESPGHAVNPASANVDNVLEPNEVKIIQTTGDKKYTKASHAVVDVGAGGTEVRNFSWNADIAVIGLRVFLEAPQFDDTMDIALNVNYSLGNLSQSAGSGATELVVDPLVAGYVGIGDHVRLSEGATLEDLGEVTDFVLGTSTITVTTATTASFTTAADVQVTKYFAKDLPMPSASVGKLTVGEDTIEGIETPKGAVYTFIIRNTDASASRYIIYVLYAIGQT
jgi:hypothetical protein